MYAARPWRRLVLSLDPKKRKIFKQNFNPSEIKGFFNHRIIRLYWSTFCNLLFSAPKRFVNRAWIGPYIQGPRAVPTNGRHSTAKSFWLLTHTHTKTHYRFPTPCPGTVTLDLTVHCPSLWKSNQHPTA